MTMTSSAQPSRPTEGGGIVIKPSAVAIVTVLIGLFPIFDINDWRLGAPVFFLATAWVALVLTGLWLWRAGSSVAAEGAGSGDVGFELTTHRDELLQEKRALLKAIKEIEFDREMGKMSEEDADSLTRLYRRQAIDVIKALDEGGDETESADAIIERELRARLEVDRATKKGKKAKKADKAEKADEAAKPETSATSADTTEVGDEEDEV